MLRVGKTYNKPLKQITLKSGLCRENLRDERYHESKTSQSITWLTY